MKNVKFLRAIIGLLLVVVITETALFGYREVLYRPAPEEVNHDINDIADKIVAEIGNVQIKQSELANHLYASHGAELINQMLDREAIQMEADEMGLKLTRADIDEELKRMQQGYESEALFYKSMKEQVGLTESELRQDVNFKLLIERIATKNIDVSDKEITAYKTEHSEEFRNTVLLHIEQIEVNSMTEASKVMELLKKGVDFKKVAMENSTDSATVTDGGDLGWVEEDDPFIPAPILQVAKVLSVGEYSQPIKVETNYYIVRLVDFKQDSKGTVEEINTALRKQLALQKARPLKDIIRDLREKRNAVILDPLLK
ncbi:MAG: peptidyl-prolyl cis-trans isomerase [Paenibacillaceae bacterium]